MSAHEVLLLLLAVAPGSQAVCDRASDDLVTRSCDFIIIMGVSGSRGAVDRLPVAGDR